jgi:tRNA pseudouridine38-40 synthase
MTRRLRLTVSYDGRPFCGWQSQAGKGSVQDALEAALAPLNHGVRIPVHGSGRTDAGVHALAQSAHADVPRASRLTLRGWVAALNAHLPPEVRVTRCQWAGPEFHARFSAKGKRYIYRVWNGPVLPPLEIGRAWQVPHPLDLSRLRAAAALLTGTHDFGGFAANRGVPCPDTVRTVRKIDLKGRPGGLITLTFEGDGFLYKMVRLLTGSLVRVAINRAAPEWLAGLLEPPQPGAPRVKTSFAAPAEGLYLARVFY